VWYGWEDPRTRTSVACVGAQAVAPAGGPANTHPTFSSRGPPLNDITSAQRPSTPPVQSASERHTGVKQRPGLLTISEAGVQTDPPEQSEGLVQAGCTQVFWISALTDSATQTSPAEQVRPVHSHSSVANEQVVRTDCWATSQIASSAARRKQVFPS